MENFFLCSGNSDKLVSYETIASGTLINALMLETNGILL